MAQILVFGDSIVEGLNDFKNGGWVGLLKDYTEENFKELRVLNKGVSGDTSLDILARFEAEAGKHKPQLIIFSYGTNDAYYFLQTGDSAVSKQEFLNNTKKLTALAHNLQSEVIFIGPIGVDDRLVQPMPWQPDIAYANDLIKEYNEILKIFCESKGLRFVDVFGRIDKEMLDDGVHPSTEGHKKLFEIILEEIKPILEESLVNLSMKI